MPTKSRYKTMENSKGFSLPLMSHPSSSNPLFKNKTLKYILNGQVLFTRSIHSRSRICLLANPPDHGFPPNAPSESSSLELFLCLHILSFNCEEAGAQPALPGAASGILCPVPSATPTFCQVTITDQLHPSPPS